MFETPALLKLREEARKAGSESSGLVPLEDFFKNPALSSCKISPDGKYMACLKPWKNRMNIYIRKTNKPKSE